MSACFEIVRRGSEGFRIYAGKKGTRNVWERPWNSGHGVQYSTTGSAHRAIKRLKVGSYSKQVLFVRAVVENTGSYFKFISRKGIS